MVEYSGSRAAKSKKLDGLILLGSYLPATPGFTEDYLTYPLPILGVFGELDGLTGINFAAREYEKMLSYQAEMGSDFRRQVVVLEGINHMQFADGKYLAGDLDAAISLSQAHEAVAQVVIAFMERNVTGFSSKARSYLKQAKVETARLIAPILNAKSADASICQRAQKMSAQLEDFSAIRIQENKYTSKLSYPKFILDKSYIESEQDGYVLGISTFQENVLNLTDVSSGQYLSPEVVGCKLRSQQALVDFTGIRPLASAQSCAELNAYEFKQAWETMTAAQQVRLQKPLVRA